MVLKSNCTDTVIIFIDILIKKILSTENLNTWPWGDESASDQHCLGGFGTHECALIVW